MPELERKSVLEFRESEKLPIIIVLDEVRSMNNVGSVFRSADAFLVEAIYLCGYTPTPPHRDIQKTALGATETVSWKHFTSTREAIETLQQEGYTIYSIEQVHESIMLHNMVIEKNKKYAFVLGNEVQGVQDEVIQLSDAVIEIPQLGSKHSLNVSVSAGIVLWEAARRFIN
ncbi:MAG: RNA methyltransferase [Bacteroidetes bacterium]|nr:RNA methyltransferase [Bacteroidota bacterium]